MRRGINLLQQDKIFLQQYFLFLQDPKQQSSSFGYESQYKSDTHETCLVILQIQIHSVYSLFYIVHYYSCKPG